MPEAEKLSDRIRASSDSGGAISEKLSTHEQIIARITDGIYRQPGSALRELISNAYDADATEVIVQTDAPRFSQISVRDNGNGLSPEVIGHLIKNIGGSAKHTKKGRQLGVTATSATSLSPAGRKLIGKLGIGLFSVAQFTRHFLILSKTAKDKYTTVVDITLGPVLDGAGREETADGTYDAGEAQIWRTLSSELSSHGTEIKLLDLLPRTRAELASLDMWARIDAGPEDDAFNTKIPNFHIGRMRHGDGEILQIQPSLPWDDSDKPLHRFNKLVSIVKDLALEGQGIVDLDQVFDNYLQTLWSLALSAPLDYYDVHPFDLKSSNQIHFFEVANSPKGQAAPLNLEVSQKCRDALQLKTPSDSNTIPFKIIMDGVELRRPVIFRDLPKIKKDNPNALMFLGKAAPRFEQKPIELSGGPLAFEAYLFWSPCIVPKQHRGIAIRIGNASGTLFDRTFMNYQVSEQTRLRQITAEIFVIEGLDGALNLDRESFNYAHPHYQYIVKWTHSALRQLANRHKEIGTKVRKARLEVDDERVRLKLDSVLVNSLRYRGVQDLADVTFVDNESKQKQEVLHLDEGLTIDLGGCRSSLAESNNAFKQSDFAPIERKAKALIQLLYGWGLLDDLSVLDRERLLSDIIAILLLDN